MRGSASAPVSVFVSVVVGGGGAGPMAVRGRLGKKRKYFMTFLTKLDPVSRRAGNWRRD